MGLLWLDLDEWPAIQQLSRWVGRSRWAPFTWRETDYLPQFTRHGIRLKTAVQDRVEQALGRRPSGRVCLLTQPRSWGVAFNPVSFFYCYDAADSLMAIVCEVSNTPWHERYHYVLPTHPEGESRHRVEKSFHVSPFLPRELEYRMRFNVPGERIHVLMQDWQGEQKVFEASLNLQRKALTRQSLQRHVLSFPWMTGKTVAAIYWQALRLLFKRTPIFDHEPTESQFRTADLEPRND